MDSMDQLLKRTVDEIATVSQTNVWERMRTTCQYFDDDAWAKKTNYCGHKGNDSDDCTFEKCPLLEGLA